jgi:hypothetical protein
MEYELKITMYAENKDYEKQLTAYEDRNKYRNGYEREDSCPQKTVLVNLLSVRVDQKQFEAIRKAALEVF